MKADASPRERKVAAVGVGWQAVVEPAQKSQSPARVVADERDLLVRQGRSGTVRYGSILQCVRLKRDTRE